MQVFQCLKRTMAGVAEDCTICGKKLSEGDIRTVKGDGSKSFIAASKKRQDSIHYQTRKRSALNVHVNCAKSYPFEKSISSYLRQVEASPSRELTPNTRSRCNSSVFDFAKLCLYCAEDASDNVIERQKPLNDDRKTMVRLVRDATVREIYSEISFNFG